VFRGVYEHQIDAKGRTSLPAKLRETLVGAYDERLVVTTALDPCLHAYPVREWEQLEAALAIRNPMESGVKTLMRLYVAPAQECPLDKLGRLLIPPTLRAHAGLEKDVVWAGMVKVIELWSRDGWRKAQEEARCRRLGRCHARAHRCATEGSNRDQGGEEGDADRDRAVAQAEAHHPLLHGELDRDASAPSGTGCSACSIRAASGWYWI
jgi:MraZ protein